MTWSDGCFWPGVQPGTWTVPGAYCSVPDSYALPPFTHSNRWWCQCRLALRPGFGGQQAWVNITSHKTKRKDREKVIKGKAYTVKHCSNTEGRQRITKTTFTHTHTRTQTASPDIYIRRGRTQWACGGIEGWGGEVGHAIGRL